jgi:hypothetical protein
MHVLIVYRREGSVTVHQQKEYRFHSRTRKNIELIIYLQGFTDYPDGNYLQSTKAGKGGFVQVKKTSWNLNPKWNAFGPHITQQFGADSSISGDL